MYRDLQKSRGKKRIGLLCVLIAIAIISGGIFTGCGDGAAFGNKINAPCEIKYLTANPLAVEEVEVNKEGEPIDRDGFPSYYEYDMMTEEERAVWNDKDFFLRGSYIQIEGLKDKEVQAKVNEKIKNLYMENVNKLPPYRGIKAMIGENPEEKNDRYTYVSVYANGNFNNILSVVFSRDYCYEGALGEDIYVYTTEPLNIDLNTGEEISISQLFCDNVDGLQIVNEAVSEEIVRRNAEDEEGGFYYYGFNLTKPFTGISENQKYFLTEVGINVVIDYEMPEFDTNFRAESIHVRLSDDMALLQRWYNDGENIYESEEPVVKKFPYYDYGKNIIEVNEEDELGGIEVSLRASYSEDLPDFIKKRLEDLSQIDDNYMMDEIKAYGDKFRTEYGADADIRCDYSIASHTAGNFAGLTKDVYIYALSPYDGRYYDDVHYQVLEAYDMGGGGEPMTLKDVFREGFDYESKVKEAMAAAVDKNIAIRRDWDAYTENTWTTVFGVGESEAMDKEYIDRVYEAINGFTISNSYLNFSIEDIYGIFEEVYGAAPRFYEDGTAYIHSLTSLDYAELGCDNLAIFD